MLIIIYLFTLLPLFYTHSKPNQLNYTLDRVDFSAELPNGRILSISERRSLRITAYYYLNDYSPKAVSKIKDNLVPAAIAFYRSALKVDRLDTKLKVPEELSSGCGDVNPPSELADPGIDSDLVIFVKGELDPESSLTAAARACVLMNPTSRPVLGVISYNFAKDWENTDDISLEFDLINTLHELGHVLGFSPSLFDNYINPLTGKTLPYPVINKTINGVETSILKLEPLTRRLRKYFDCPTLEGAYLENQGDEGSIGSHFERRIFLNEFMTASTTEDRRVSEFSLAVFEGTGWYTPNYSMAEPLFWGKGKGCGFLNQTCIDTTTKLARFNEFCSNRTQGGCTFTGGAKGFCGNDETTQDTSLPSAFDYFGDKADVKDVYADNCPYYDGASRSNCYDPADAKSRRIDDEFYGTGSMCFSGTLNKGSALGDTTQYCFKQTCQSTGENNYTLTLEVGEYTVTCPSERSVRVPGYKGVIYCPNVNQYCSTTALKYCKRGCMGRGTCINGECHCFKGFGGPGCSFKISLLPVDNKSDQKPFLHIIAIFGGIAIIALIVIPIWIKKRRQAKRARNIDDMNDYKSVSNDLGKTVIVFGDNKGNEAKKIDDIPKGIKLGVVRRHFSEPPKIEDRSQEVPRSDFYQEKSCSKKVDPLKIVKALRTQGSMK